MMTQTWIEAILAVFLLTNIIRGGLMFTIALSIEELVCGLAARMIWKKQYKTVMMQE